jgi:transposase
MRPYGTDQQLKRRCEEALALLKQGKSVEQVGAKMGVTIQSVYRWLREQKHPRKPSSTPPGKSAYLSKEQIRKLEQELLRGAYAHGYSEDYWTLDRMAKDKKVA